MRTIRLQKTSGLSATKEDYVRAIFLLRTYPDASPTVTQIAKRLDLSKSTVSERMKDLAKDGLVNTSPYSEITLTKTGEAIAEKLTYKHRLIEVFLHKVLKMPTETVHAEAEKLEHACSDDVIQRLAHFLDYPATDPHGTKIDVPQNWKSPFN